MSIYGVPEEYMHCFNVFDEIPKYEPMEFENINDLYQTTELEWHHWKGPNEDDSICRQTLENENHSKAEEQQIIVDIQNDLKQSRKKVISKKTRGVYRTYSPEQVQELLDLVIEEGLSARKAGAIVGIVERTAQNYVKTYKEDEEKRLLGGRKQRVSWERKLQPQHTNFLCMFYEKNPQAVLWQARDALLEAFSEIQSIILSGLHRYLVSHASSTLKKLEAVVSSRTSLDVWLLSQCFKNAIRKFTVKNQYLCFSTLGSHRKKMSGINLNIRSKISIEVNSSGEPHSNESETTRPNKKSRPVNEMPDEKDKVLEGFNKSIGTAIKQHAHSVYKDNFYHKLNNTQKNSISNGFNSILDLTDNDKEKHSQRGLFTEDEWLELNRLWNKQKKWTPINKDIQKELKYIEQLAVADIKKAYCKCLKYQIEHAMTENETCFEVYALLLKILHDKKALLHSSTTEKFTEGDYVINVWSRIFSDVFEDRKNNLICKWGDTVPEESTSYKKVSQDFDGSTIGDKIDLRICCLSPGGKVVDLVSVEFAKNSSNDKYFSDHRKVLREVKINIDRFYRSPFMKRRDKRNISGHCIQIARAEGQIKQVCLVDNGLYVASRIGSLRLPSSQTDLRKARTLLERLFTLKQIKPDKLLRIIRARRIC
ncbi:hypothetical protein G6F58_005424 [Rhizopus delemar]|nr:hypothetical protein G6F58_005424 [Rhizopus delemar]